MSSSNVAPAPPPQVISAAQIATGDLEPLGKRIAAQLQKARDYEAKAHEKAGVELRKADDHWNTVTQLLAEAKTKCDGEGFAAFQEKYCPDLGRSRIYELVAIGVGKTTPEEVRAAAAERTRKYRAKKKAAAEKAAAEKAAAEQTPDPSVTVTDDVGEGRAPTPVTADDNDGVQRHTDYHMAHENDEAPAKDEQQQPAANPADEQPAEPAKSPAELIEEAEAEVKRLKALRAERLKADADGDTRAGPDSKIDPAADAKAFAEFKAACTYLPEMSSNYLQRAIDHFADVVEMPAAELMPDLAERIKSVQMDLKIAKAKNTVLRRQLANMLPPRESRVAAWQRLSAEAATATEQLVDYQQQFQEMKDSLPDNLQSSAQAEKCEAICNIDLESALGALQEAADAEVPLGYGRD